MNHKRIFVTGTDTGIGKTLISAMLVEAFKADYWKPVQAGYAEGTDSETIRDLVSNNKTVIHPEAYLLKLAASPHLAAREENISIDLDKLAESMPMTSNMLIMEGAGGLMAPLNEKEFVADLILKLGAPVILVSRNTLGSINHSLLTAYACKQMGIRVMGWIFNHRYMDYEDDIAKWTGLPKLADVPYSEDNGKEFIFHQAAVIRELSEKWPC